ncbi:hypothetical protein QBC43DRAFT_283544 [Cladorrhinum sp. PSN259]|nr:hypothetical protein QBC43DRAFT_283544 [Cladorrhinum sp. PSN259]
MVGTKEIYAHGSTIDQTPYQLWIDHTTRDVQTTAGALLPPNYQKTDDPSLPWNAHQAASLNDNLDGTLSDIGYYADPERGNGVSSGGAVKPPVIMSKQWMSLEEAPLVDMEPCKAASKVTESTATPRRSLRTAPQKANTLAPRASFSTPKKLLTKHKMLSSKNKKNQVTTPSRGGPHREIPAASTLWGTHGNGDVDTFVPDFTLQGTGSNTFVGIEMATATRRYGEWQDENGNTVDLGGALLPEGYQLDLRHQDYTWVCPIRSCRLLCMSFRGLSWHFKRGHKTSELNDNGDGTFSIVGTYDGKAARVVSKNALNPNEPSMAEPHVSSYRQKKGVRKLPKRGRLRLEEFEKHLQPSPPTRSQARLQFDSRLTPNIYPIQHHHRDTQQGGSEHHITNKQTLQPSAIGDSAANDQSSFFGDSTTTLPGHDVELENWETQGGRIVSTKAAWSKDLAFSGAYLAAFRTISLTERLTVTMVTVLPGRLEVRLDNEPSFGISAGGLFRVTPGGSCYVMNMSNTEVVLNVTVVQARQ